MNLCTVRLLWLGLLPIAFASSTQAQTATPEQPALTPPLVAVSPVKAIQGYATDGSVHYMFSTNDIAAYDKDWAPVENKSPFDGMPPGANHVGDGDVYQGEIYAPVEAYNSCDDNTHQRIAIYNAKDGAFKRFVDLSSYGHEVSSVTIVPSTQSVVVSSFCDSDRVFQYDLKTMKPLAPIMLSSTIVKIQGIAWSEKRQQFAITSDSPAEKIGYVWVMTPEGKVSLVYTAPQTGELEGVDYSQDQIRYLLGNVWSLSPEVGRNPDFHDTWSFGMTTTGDPLASQIVEMKKLTDDLAELERYRKDNTALPAVKPGENRVVFYGDSITDSWGNRPDKWPFFAGKGYIDRGISGQTTAQMLIRFRQDVIDLHPKVVLLLAGTNDVAGNIGPVSLQMVADNIASMAELARANGIRMVLCSALPADHYKWRQDIKPAEPLRRLNAWMKQYAAAHNLVYVDYYAALTNANGGMKDGTSLDGVHPTASGYALMEPLAEQGISEAMQRKPSVECSAE